MLHINHKYLFSSAALHVGLGAALALVTTQPISVDKIAVSVVIKQKASRVDMHDATSATKAIPATPAQPTRVARASPPPHTRAKKIVHGAISGNVNVADNASEVLGVDDNNVQGAPVRKIPELIKSEIKIPYPSRARALLIEGVVRMLLTVSEDGRVTNVKVLSGPAFGLQEAAHAVAKKLWFLPATDENGHGKISEVEHEVVFRLTDQS